METNLRYLVRLNAANIVCIVHKVNGAS